MSRNGRVLVAMSGGVDSSVAACLLKEQGYDCVGVFMRVGVSHDEPEDVCALGDVSAASHPKSKIQNPKSLRRLKHGCCSATDAMDARAIAGRLGIPFYALNFQPDFDRIIDYFVEEYGQARTPNPCVMCNIHLKFGKLLRYAEMMDAEFVATGHYARTLSVETLSDDFGFWILDFGLEDGHVPVEEQSKIQNPKSKIVLARAVNLAKDQSYVLFGIRREDLPRCRFPIGEIADKAEVRRIAADLGLRVHDKPDSQEICFVPNNDYRQLIERRRPELVREGEMVDASGRVLAQHAGVAAYTIGQRHGLGVALGKPMYVTGLNVLTNTVTIGPREELLSDGLIAEKMNWLVGSVGPPWPTPNAHDAPVTIKIRHMHNPAPGRIRMLENGDVQATFDEPQSAVTPGQAAVFYAGDVVLGGGWIRSATSRSE